MPEIISISFPNGCKLLDDAKKGYSAGVPISQIIRDGLAALIEKNNSGEIKVSLPKWRQFDKTIADATDLEFKEIESRVKQFQNLIEARRAFRRAVRKIES